MWARERQLRNALAEWPVSKPVEHFLDWWLMWGNKASTIESRAVSSAPPWSPLRFLPPDGCPELLLSFPSMLAYEVEVVRGNKLFPPWATLGRGVYHIDRKRTDIPWSRRPGRIVGRGKGDWHKGLWHKIWGVCHTKMGVPDSWHLGTVWCSQRDHSALMGHPPNFSQQ